jgi:hypothetical protein
MSAPKAGLEPSVSRPNVSSATMVRRWRFIYLKFYRLIVEKLVENPHGLKS